ncbi:hypothetical protein B4119_0741 [Parageobacillus caldoxylosilyticus]|jgi:hypothetical protein|uniref:Uncharacterized protein n=1 Tax=Saccharococcus caldoxylosilyticus TaxID=81408 RepID=A0A150M0G6_9BACL|nr:hypothetical protein B4119_0741 [Parageobacillus caldoxylosilyticus]
MRAVCNIIFKRTRKGIQRCKLRVDAFSSFTEWKIKRVAIAVLSFYTGYVGMEREAHFFLPKHEHMC